MAINWNYHFGYLTKKNLFRYISYITIQVKIDRDKEFGLYCTALVGIV